MCVCLRACVPSVREHAWAERAHMLAREGMIASERGSEKDWVSQDVSASITYPIPFNYHSITIQLPSHYFYHSSFQVDDQFTTPLPFQYFKFHPINITFTIPRCGLIATPLPFQYHF